MCDTHVWHTQVWHLPSLAALGARAPKNECVRVSYVWHGCVTRTMCVSHVCCSVVQCGAVWCSVYPRTCAKFTQDSLSYQKRHTCGSERVKGYAEYFFATPMPKPPGGPGGPWGALGDPGGPTHLPQTSCEKTLFSDFGAKIQIYGAKFKYLASKHVAPQLK